MKVDSAVAAAVMRERSATTPRRRGPKLPLPRERIQYVRTEEDEERERFDVTASESPYYTIDNTEDIYGTTLSPAQRCYVDPWDLENYDYVRKKIATPPSPNAYYEASTSPSPVDERSISKYYEAPLVAPRMAATMPRNNRRRSSHLQCNLPCCKPAPVQVRGRHYEELELRDDLYGVRRASNDGGKYQDYMMPEEEDGEQNIYIGYGGFSSASSTEPHSSIGEESLSILMPRPTPTYGGGRQSNAGTLVRAAPKLEFPAPPSIPPTYDYCNPYATLPCSVSDCYECMSQLQNGSSLIYAAPSMYGSSSMYAGGGGGGGGNSAGYSSTLGRRRPSSSLYGGIYNTKFGLSKKGLLQIDYSCSWNDLDRVMGRNY